MSDFESAGTDPGLMFRIGEKLFLGGCILLGTGGDVAILNGPATDILISGTALAVSGMACMFGNRITTVVPPDDPGREPLPEGTLHLLPGLAAREYDLPEDLRSAA